MSLFLKSLWGSPPSGHSEIQTQNIRGRKIIIRKLHGYQGMEPKCIFRIWANSSYFESSNDLLPLSLNMREGRCCSRRSHEQGISSIMKANLGAFARYSWQYILQMGSRTVTYMGTLRPPGGVSGVARGVSCKRGSVHLPRPPFSNKIFRTPRWGFDFRSLQGVSIPLTGCMGCHPLTPVPMYAATLQMWRNKEHPEVLRPSIQRTCKSGE